MDISKENIVFFERGLIKFYKQYGRADLPWREKSAGAYEIWVSEVMLQQTQVSRVIDYYLRFLERFPDITTLAQATWEEFLPYYRGLGYYRRGENMLKTARALVENHNGTFPNDFVALEQLPGIGRYTARAIASFAYERDALSWDTNFARVFGRFFAGSKNIPLTPDVFEGRIEHSKKIFNAAVMDFGSLVCVRTPKCLACPLRSRCEYFSRDGRHEAKLDSPRQRFRATKTQTIVVLHKDNKVFYSSSPAGYRPFVLPSLCTSREQIKRYFHEQYGLEISVRPPWHTIHTQESARVFIKAQILLGLQTFVQFTKSDADAIIKPMIMG